MNYRPQRRAKGDGRYRAEGLLFHMPGRWQFVVRRRARRPPRAAGRRRRRWSESARGLLAALVAGPRASPARHDGSSSSRPSRSARAPAARAVAAAGAARSEQSRLRAMRAAIALGRRLFFDAAAVGERHRRLRDAATCPTRGWTDGRARAVGLGARRSQHADGARRRPAAAGSAGTARADSLWSQSVKPHRSIRARWAASAAHVAAARARRPDARVPARERVRRAAGHGRPSACSWTPARRSPRSWRRVPLGPHALRRVPRRARARRRRGSGAVSRRGAARAQDLRRQGPVQRLPLRARRSPTASSTTSASRSRSRPAASTPVGTSGIKRLRSDPFNLLGPCSDDRVGNGGDEDAPRRADARELRPVQDPDAAQCRAHRALHARRAATRRCATWCGTTRSSTWSACTPTASSCCGR